LCCKFYNTLIDDFLYLALSPSGIFVDEIAQLWTTIALMNTSTKKSILFQLILVIAGASIISAIISSVGHYIFTTSLIAKSASEQAEAAIKLTKNLLIDENNHIDHDLKLLQSSPLITSITTADATHQSIKFTQAKKLLKGFISSSNTSYESIIVLDSHQKVVLSVNANDMSRSYRPQNALNQANHIDSINFSLSETFHKITQSNHDDSLFYGPKIGEKGDLFFSGIKTNIGGNTENYGAIIIVFNINQLIERLATIKIYNHPVVWLFSYNGKKLYQPKDDNALDPSKYMFDQKETPEHIIVRFSEQEKNDSIKNLIQTAVSIPPQSIKRLLQQSIFVMSAIVFGMALVIIFIAYNVAKRIVLPIQHLTMLSQKVAAGDFNVRMPVIRKDELGTLGQAFNIMIQELDEQRHELQSLANKDTLTQLPNRRQFEEHLSIVINSSKRNHQSIAVMYIDLDQFKDTNDSFGHPAGDKLIRDVSTRLLQTVRQSDLVARLGGDEFAIILNPHKSKSNTEFVAKKILGELNKPFLIEKQQIFSGGSIGISIYPEHGENLTELVKNADAAMYKAKNMGRNSYQFYSKNLTEKANERVVLGALIRNAIAKDQFTLFYQPKINLISKQVIGAEALLRWQHKGQTILPSKIIHVAESSGFIEKVDAWVLNRACLQIKEWEQSEKTIIPISINISGRLLGRNKITDMLKHALYKYSLDPKWIEIEITENDLVSDHENTQKILEIIHGLGVKIAIDDFGTGYSSLSYLKDLSADTLKIDRKFVVNAMANHADREIASAIVKLARSLNMHVVVEGIETEEQELFFKGLGAHSAQGYLYAKAMPMDKFIAFIDTYTPENPTTR
jgi:diguanylate cyclase (GGDEF)-like protein